MIPRDFWLEDWERQAIIDYYQKNPLAGYRRLTFMMLDQDIVAVSPSSVYRVLMAAGLLKRWNGKKSKKGTGFVQPLKPHEHWHIDISYINICGTFYYLCSLLDGYSRYIVHYNDERLHSSLGYVAPKDKLEYREKIIFKDRDEKLEAAREARKQKRRHEKHLHAQYQRTPERETFHPLTQHG